MLITSVGGIVLAIFLTYVLFQVLTNDLTGIKEAINAQTKIQVDTNNVLRENATIMGANTAILKILEAKID